MPLPLSSWKVTVGVRHPSPLLCPSRRHPDSALGTWSLSESGCPFPPCIPHPLRPAVPVHQRKRRGSRTRPVWSERVDASPDQAASSFSSWSSARGLEKVAGLLRPQRPCIGLPLTAQCVFMRQDSHRLLRKGPGWASEEKSSGWRCLSSEPQCPLPVRPLELLRNCHCGPRRMTF